MNSVFQAYGIRVKYPERFRIYINQRQQFNNRNGMVKFDDTVGPQDGRISLTVSWEEAKEQTEFGKQYLEHAEEHYSKKVKNRYRILDKELLTKDGHEIAFLHTLLLSQTHIFKAIGKNIQLEIMQTARYCDETNRIIIATVMAERSYFKGHESGLKQMLATVYKGNIIKNLIMDCQSYTKYRPNETTGGIFVSWRRKEELPTGA